MDFIASSVKSNVRELEGALIRLAAYASLSRRTIDLPFAQETLGGAITRPREVVTTDSIIKAVATYYGVKSADIKSGDRHKSIVTPRAVAMYLARQHTSASYPDLGRSFGNKHHTTVMSAVERFEMHMRGVSGVQSVVSVSSLAKVVIGAYNEGNPRWEALPRSSEGLGQGAKAYDPDNGMNTSNCQAIQVLIYTANHEGATIAHIVREIRRFTAADKTANVAFRLAGGNIGVMAATRVQSRASWTSAAAAASRSRREPTEVFSV